MNNSHPQHTRYKVCTFGCDWPVIKGTLYGVKVLFLMYFGLYWRDCAQNSYLILSTHAQFWLRSVSKWGKFIWRTICLFRWISVYIGGIFRPTLCISISKAL